MKNQNALSLHLQGIVNNHISPGVVVVASCREQKIEESFGRYTYEANSPDANLTTLYELSSVSKVFTATAILRLVRANQISLEDKVCKYFPEFQFSEIDIKSLLSHTSGLGLSLSSLLELEKDEAMKRVFSQGQIAPWGTQIYYSDQGFLILGLIVEKITNSLLHEAMRKHVLDPLALSAITYDPYPELCTPTEIETTSGTTIKGQVHNEFSRKFNQIFGHTGLFANALDLHQFGKTWLDCLQGKSDFLPVELAKRALEVQKVARNASGFGWEFGLAWRVNCREKLGEKFSKSSFEMTGFTGPELSIDPENEIVSAVLSNRTFPHRSPKAPWEKSQSIINDFVFSRFQ